ncbi:MAG: hypothetical protein M3Z32_11815 [Acidobacteriota bacterium]|nr:hypothetical protein [Acidobacteriota bacterium]
MSSYLEEYGSAEEQKAKRGRLVKRSIIGLILLLILAGLGYVLLKNYPEERQAKAFLENLRKPDFQAAYRMWGCTESTPCRDYGFQKFMDDWGPKGSHADIGSAHIGMSQSCGTGVLLRIDYNGAEPVPLWVERGTHLVSFAPWPECPGRHLHIGTFLRSLFK